MMASLGVNVYNHLEEENGKRPLNCKKIAPLEGEIDSGIPSYKLKRLLAGR